MSDDEPVDAKIALSKKYEPQCAKHWKEYQECGKRLEKLGPDSGKNCGGWYNEYWKCMDQQVTHTQSCTSRRAQRTPTHSSCLHSLSTLCDCCA